MGDGNEVLELVLLGTTGGAMVYGILARWKRQLRKGLLPVSGFLAAATLAGWLMYFFQVPAEWSTDGVESFTVSFGLLTLSVIFAGWGVLELTKKHLLQRCVGATLLLAGVGLIAGVLWLQSLSQTN
jgi:hypothetical protein